MKKSTVITWILLVILLATPTNVFSDRRSWPFIFWREGDIEGLQFTFYPEALPVTLPSSISLSITDILIETSGKELAIVYPSGLYLYFGKYDGGCVYAETLEYEYPIPVRMRSADLAEVFTIDGPIPPSNPFNVEPSDYEELDLYFKATLEDPLDGSVFDFVLLVLNGTVVYAGIVD